MEINKVTMKSIDLKRFFLVTLFMSCFIPLAFSPLAFSQSANAVYLKNGERVIGHILELDSLGGDVKMLTMEGTLVSVAGYDIDKVNWSYVIKEQGPGAIYRYGDMFRWKFSDTELSDKNYDRYFDDDLYHTYVSASNQFNIGGACWLYGVTCLVLTVLEFDPKADSQSGRFYLYAGGANALICLGSVFTAIGKRRLDWVARTFNAMNAADNELSFSPSLMVTPQWNLGLGATLSFSF